MKTTSGCTAFFPLRTPLFHCAGTFHQTVLQFTVLELSSLKKTVTVSVRVSDSRRWPLAPRATVVLCCTSVKGLFKCKVDDMHFMIKHFTRHFTESKVAVAEHSALCRCPLHNLTAGVKNVLTKYLTEGVISQKHGGSSNTTRPGFPDLISRPFSNPQFCIIHTSSLVYEVNLSCHELSY